MAQPVSFKRRDVLALASGLALLGPGCATGAAPTGRSRIANTTSGALEGVIENGVNAFKGVRYAAPPIGALRFKPPQPAARASGVVDASHFGAPAVQMYSRPSGEPSSALGKSLFEVFPTGSETRAGSEDCLFVNVWTRGVHDGRRRPVMVWLHGGGMVYGSAAWPAFHGYNLARKHDVVVVTVNHRLNAFGYCYLAEAFGEDYADAGNAGHLDLVAALSWVRENADAFGGDAHNVTIFGQSGGGAKVSTLMATPAARGMFHKAIVESGPALRVTARENAARTAEALLGELQIPRGDVKALQAAPAEQIRMALYAVQAKAHGSWGPVLDGRTLTRHPFDPDAPAQSIDVPLLIGTNKDEAALFSASAPWFGTLTDADLSARASDIVGLKAPALIDAFRKLHPANTPTFLLTDLLTAAQFWAPSVLEAERKSRQGGAPTYMYRMDWGTPIGGGVYRAGHSVETPLVFDTVEANRALLGPGPEPQILAAQMSAAWAAFARKGDPNHALIPSWPRYDLTTRATMIFDLKSRVDHDPNAAVRALLVG